MARNCSNSMSARFQQGLLQQETDGRSGNGTVLLLCRSLAQLVYDQLHIAVHWRILTIAGNTGFEAANRLLELILDQMTEAAGKQAQEMIGGQCMQRSPGFLCPYRFAAGKLQQT